MSVQSPEGMLFAGKYRINKLIGKGGMANVYLATDMGSGVKVAIKILKPELASDEEFIRRFDTEAKAAASLNHSNIVKVFGVGHEGGFRYIVQEYVDGITVKDLINQNGHLDWKVTVPVVIQVGMALEYAHNQGIVHRDIKPQNIMISRDRIAKITDFGIARATNGNTITMTGGGAMGSVHYFSPEQARGGNVGPASDIYSIGVMLFEMVTGRVPFNGDSNVAIAVKHLQEKPPVASSFVPGIPSGLDAIINKCMQKTPDKRYSSMREMVTELDALMLDPNGVYGVIAATPGTVKAPEPEPGNISFRQEPNYDRIGDLEKSAEARRRSRIRDNILLVLVVVCIIGVLLGGAFWIISTIKNTTTDSVTALNKDYTVENYVGMTEAEARSVLDKAEIDYEIKYEVPEDTNIQPGIVLSQSIDEGVVIRAGGVMSTLVLHVSQASDAILITDYSGMDYDSAMRTLTAQGFQVSLRPETTTDVEPNTVIRTEPAAGESLSPGSPIVIIYAKEPTSSEVPVLAGQTLEQARLLIEEAGLIISSVECAPEIASLPDNQKYVILTNPVAGVSLQRGSAIVVYVGTAEDVQRGGTPTPTPVPARVDVNVNPEGTGSVEGAGEYEIGANVTLIAHPAEGYRFDHWVDTLGNTVAYSNATADAPATYTFVAYASNSTQQVGPDGQPIQTVLTYTAVFMPAPTSTPTPTPIPPEPTDTVGTTATEPPAATIDPAPATPQ